MKEPGIEVAQERENQADATPEGPDQRGSGLEAGGAVEAPDAEHEELSGSHAKVAEQLGKLVWSEAEDEPAEQRGGSAARNVAAEQVSSEGGEGERRPGGDIMGQGHAGEPLDRERQQAPQRVQHMKVVGVALRREEAGEVVWRGARV